MSRKSIAEFDPSIYLTLPRMTVTSLLTLARVLVRLTPELALAEPEPEPEESEDPSEPEDPMLEIAARWPQVAHTAEGVREAIAAIDAVMVARIRGLGRYTRDDVKFDAFIDGLWVLFRDRLTGWSRYLAEGRQRLVADPSLEIDLEILKAQAERAQAILDLLLGDGLEFLRARYSEQSVTMGHVLEAIDAEGLDADLRELTGDELLPLIRAAARHYEDMVEGRLRRDASARAGNLTEVGAKLRSAVFYHVNAIISTLHAAEATSVESVEAVLLPIVNVRLGRSVVAGSTISVEEVAGVEAQLDEASGEGAKSQAVAAEASE